MTEHAEWLENEYVQWETALKQSDPTNFKDRPEVRRMLSLDLDQDLLWVYDGHLLRDLTDHETLLLCRLDKVGHQDTLTPTPMSAAAGRMAFYALQVLSRRPDSILEVGGGCGQFFATLRILGYRGRYSIVDRVKVQDFQRRYLAYVGGLFDLDLRLSRPRPEDSLFCSFYALGEFTDEMKDRAVNDFAARCPEGLVVWNPHSGASSDIPYFGRPARITDEFPKTAPNNKRIEW